MDGNKGRTMDEQALRDRAAMARAQYASDYAKSMRTRAAAERLLAATWTGGRSVAGERNDCTVRALTLATHLTYEQAHALMAKHGRKNGHGAHVEPALRELGLGVKVDGRGATVARFAAGEARRGVWIVRVRGHVFAQIDGKQLDTHLNGARTRVLWAWRIAD